MSEKCLSEMKIHMPESLKRDLQDLADQSDRKTSELVRVVLEDFMYGAQRRLCGPLGPGAGRDGEGRHG